MTPSEELELLKLRDEKTSMQKWNYFGAGFLSMFLVCAAVGMYIRSEVMGVVAHLDAQIQQISQQRDTCMANANQIQVPKTARPAPEPWVQ